uniref:Uncharacterized protein n=1 Tax=Urocitellus parryii TaxID=9999 RepID=A0A8D2HQW9_UROPR
MDFCFGSVLSVPEQFFWEGGLCVCTCLFNLSGCLASLKFLYIFHFCCFCVFSIPTTSPLLFSQGFYPDSRLFWLASLLHLLEENPPSQPPTFSYFGTVGWLRGSRNHRGYQTSHFGGSGEVNVDPPQSSF